MSKLPVPALPVYNTEPASGRPRSPAPFARTSSSITSVYSLLSPQDTAERLHTSLGQGLLQGEAHARLAKDGPNELPHEEEEPLWLRFLKQFKETLILLLLGSAAISLFIGNKDDAISIALAVTIVVTVGFVQEYRSEKSLEALNRLVPHYAHVRRAGPRPAAPSRTASRAHGGESETIEMEPLANGVAPKSSTLIPAGQLVVGDLVLFSTGDRIPADIRITHSSDLTIDESNLTGENEPVEKHAAALDRPVRTFGGRGTPEPSNAAGTVGADLRLNEQHNIAFMGTLVRSGYGEGVVIATGGSTEFGTISLSLQEIEAPRTPLQHSMDLLGKQLSYMSFVVIGIIMLIGLIQGKNPLDLFQIGVSLAVAAIPEGLPIIVTVTLALGVLRMAKRGAIVRKLPSVETLGSVNVVCSDKTGTLTLNHMTVTKLWHFDAPLPVSVDTATQPTTAIQTVLRIGNIANNGRLSHNNSGTPATAASAAVLSSTRDLSTTATKSRWLGQPTDIAMLDLLDAYGEDDIRDKVGHRTSETPFSSERKWMGVVIGSPLGELTSGAGVGTETAFIKGSIEQILSRSDTYLTRDGREVVLDDNRRQEANAAARTMAEEGLRVIAFASGIIRNKRQSSRSSTPAGDKKAPEVDAFSSLCFAGLVGMNDPPRKDVHRSIRRLMNGGVKVIMITGDAETTAVAIGKKLGMPLNLTSSAATSVLRGDELDHMSEQELSEAIGRTTIFARTSPDHKMKIIRALQARGDVVAMTGDGVNDAPALKKADIGIAMGMLGTDVAKEAADMILTDDDFSTILRAIEQGKGIFFNIQNFITFQLSTSVAALTLVLLSTMFGFKNPLNAMQILWINILMDGPPAQSLGVEPVDPRVMNQPPRPRNANVLTKRLIRRVLTQALVIMVGTITIYIREMVDIDDPNSLDQAGTPLRTRVVTKRDTTMTFTTFVLFDMFNALTCRSESKSVLFGEIKLFGNKMFNYAVAGSLAGQLCVIYLPFLQRVFQTEGLGLWDLLRLVFITSTVFFVDELRKWTEKRRTSGLAPNVGYSASV
ncbi:High affinity Ca2+/Mn2+ P-type ATPase-like protein [Elasticomyces elasticus]|uniref:High affinity Ca2+/Mn2+ P-type ATPase-like protein n=1 Tax=Exophiala sideris TaxID=1016849 RepID=A0ABR0JFD5_9EURO|nr:High affinity Ca2+/Mn2+ P-type ATPase-like protein [Elasticomyces elasticus]KAK5025375.1 High affinity Ca2+/Mn2+ P-type ATPase-like protein [Exophiala sideris]KAK5032950.1 High affinity Ca2+/Mn2+ P-type ATPase-like protein [Exophiala sideris]KAK5063435.1 High affinity Ca2+/Mn2+ P-type ATPase-like protein [Exophiala sideris]KAK5180733.1 High affinity Ca2+/Mn2+ P-type ATPase-like protein [Eurotiomycetes sp. CCFEE 6388]